MKDFLRSSTVFQLSLERGNLAQSWCSSTMNTLRGRQDSWKQHTQFKFQNNVLAPLVSNIIDSLTEATLQLPFSCWAIVNKADVSHSWKH
jgi:hypothetical protein